MPDHLVPTIVKQPVKRFLKRSVRAAEVAWDAARREQMKDDPPEDLTIVPYIGHGNAERLVLRGRVLDGREPAAAQPGEDALAALRRSFERFITDEIPDVDLLIQIAGVEVETTTDDQGYFRVEVEAGETPFEGPWQEGRVELAAPVRGTTGLHATTIRARVPSPDCAFGVISDIDDTILETGAQRVAEMLKTTFFGSALTRIPFEGAAALYRALVAGPEGTSSNPVFYVSSSPWNLHGFLTAFMEHRAFPLGPILLRELIGKDLDRTHGSAKHERIDEILALHPTLPFVLIGDSGQHDPEIYAEVARAHPGRVKAVYIREVRLDPEDGRVEAVRGRWSVDVPFVLAADSRVVAEHAALIGLVQPGSVDP
ncbi:App1 family protein [Euzebya tangerina]|uniref:App1 family protein n=1 Tax=Euzebya tangerina TaxID=591198 RepID=UPI000E30D0A4|nr:phosphatase domain-containing protein [Euzebya tangerina]